MAFMGTAVKVETELRNEMFDHAKDLSHEYYQVNKVGNMMSLFTNDLDTIQVCVGWGFLCATYDLHFKDTAEVDMGLKYQTLVEKKCDVLNAYTTDSQIAEFDLVTLADDKKLFTDYRCSTVVRNEVLDIHPELRDVLLLMEGLISNEEMTKMNYELNTNHRLESEIAAEFLKAKGMID